MMTLGEKTAIRSVPVLYELHNLIKSSVHARAALLLLRVILTALSGLATLAALDIYGLGPLIVYFGWSPFNGNQYPLGLLLLMEISGALVLLITLIKVSYEMCYETIVRKDKRKAGHD